MRSIKEAGPLARSVIKHIKETEETKELGKYCKKMLKKHNKWIKEYGTDLDEVVNIFQEVTDEEEKKEK